MAVLYIPNTGSNLPSGTAGVPYATAMVANISLPDIAMSSFTTDLSLQFPGLVLNQTIATPTNSPQFNISGTPLGASPGLIPFQIQMFDALLNPVGAPCIYLLVVFAAPPAPVFCLRFFLGNLALNNQVCFQCPIDQATLQNMINASIISAPGFVPQILITSWTLAGIVFSVIIGTKEPITSNVIATWSIDGAPQPPVNVPMVCDLQVNRLLVIYKQPALLSKFPG